MILIACALGGLAVFNMKAVEKDSTRLAHEYVPEVGMANELERNSLLTMYAWRGYAFTEADSFLQQGRAMLGETRKSLDIAAKHAEKYTDLVKLRENVDVAKAEVASYAALSDQTVATIAAMNVDRAALDKSAASFMDNCNLFLESLNANLRREITEGAESYKVLERAEKISWINTVIGLGNDTRIKVWRAQADRNPKLIDSALENFPKMDEIFEKLSPLVRLEENIKQVAATRKSGADYRAAMLSLKANWETLDGINAQRTKVGEQVLVSAQNTAEAGLEGT